MIYLSGILLNCDVKILDTSMKQTTLYLFEDYKNNMSLSANNTASHRFRFRPIHYLGSKLRLVDFINGAVDAVDSTDGFVCDLFAGTGTVAKYLSYTRPVISVDVQEYSRVLCSALLNPLKVDFNLLEYKNSEHFSKLSWSMEPLIKYEEDCIKLAVEGDSYPLCDLLENGSIIGYEQGFTKEASSALLKCLKKVTSNLNDLGFLFGPEALISRYYGGLYFSYKQSVQFDAILDAIVNFQAIERDHFLAALLSTASDIVNTVGKQFAQPLRPRNSKGIPKRTLGPKAAKDRSHDVFKMFEVWGERYKALPRSRFLNQVYRMDCFDALEQMSEDIKVVYADPPYTRDHYSRFYHVLETFCLRDNPAISRTFINGKNNISRGVYRVGRHQSPFCIKSEAPLAFDKMFRKIRDMEAVLILSYSPYNSHKKAHPRLLTIEQLKCMAKKYFTKVSIESFGNFSHSKLNRTDKNFDIIYDAELLIICEQK